METSHGRPGLWLIKMHPLIPYTVTGEAHFERSNPPQDAV